MINDIVVMGLDGGKTNFGYAVAKISFTRKKLKVQLLETGVVPCPVNDMKEASTQRKEFVKWFRAKVRTFKITDIIAERFMTRGGGASMGTTIECISYMYGAIDQIFGEVKYVTAATWKNQVNKVIDLDAWYKDTTYTKTPHELDATLQAVYLGHLIFELKPDYKDTKQADITRQIERVSTYVKQTKRKGNTNGGVVKTARTKNRRNKKPVQQSRSRR